MTNLAITKNILAALGLMAILAIAMQLASAGISQISQASLDYEQGQKDMIAEHIAFV